MCLCGGETVPPASVERVLKEISGMGDGSDDFLLDEPGEP